MQRFSTSCFFQLLIATAIFFAFASPVQAAKSNVVTEQLDQQQTSFIPAYSILVGNGQEVAQTFIPSISGNLTKVSTLIKGNNEAVANLTIEIRPVVIGNGELINVGITEMPIPSDEVLATAELQVINFATQATWYEFVFNSPPKLVRNNSYAIILRTLDALDTPYAVCLAEGAQVDKNDPYKRGAMLVSNDYFSMWRINSYWNQDIPFMTFMAR